MEIKTYKEALTYLYNFVDFSRTHQENISPENFSLERMFELMDLLGNPQNKFPSIHVAGTKGKGSVSVFCSSVLQNSMYKVGLYTSPHLQSFTERIQINREPISSRIIGIGCCVQVFRSCLSQVKTNKTTHCRVIHNTQIVAVAAAVATIDHREVLNRVDNRVWAGVIF